MSSPLKISTPSIHTTDYVFSYSELDAYRQCPFKWQLAWQERWQHPDGPGRAAQRGTDWHAILEYYHKQQLDPEVSPRRAFRRTIRKFFASTQLTEEEELLWWMFEGYFERWKGDREWKRQEVEYRATVRIAPGLLVKVRADLIVKLRGSNRLWLVDAKSSRNLPRRQELDLHLEMALYTWALREAGIPIWGTIYDAARTQMNKEPEKQTLESRFDRILIHHTPQFLQTVANDAKTDMRQALLARPGPLYNYDMPRHIHPEWCRYRCSFTEACQAGMRGLNSRSFLKDTGFVQDFTRH